ncbi:T9SS type A sorting domain-containing protein [Wenyingzhuangia sp. 1_MG-2023]|nr:T9SS type A sorting domain-containing protein [Wenyingzhuangia sp. 1_MG-2023]
MALNKVAFDVISQKEDVVDVAITINGNTQQPPTYTSGGNREGNSFEYVFDTPITLTNSEAIEIKIVTTGLTNPVESAPRFRIEDIVFSLKKVTLGIDDVDKESNESLSLYPNPVKNAFSLTKEVVSGTLYNVSGAKVYEFTNTYRDINISNLPSGLYILNVMFKDGSNRRIKLLKE